MKAQSDLASNESKGKLNVELEYLLNYPFTEGVRLCFCPPGSAWGLKIYVAYKDHGIDIPLDPDIVLVSSGSTIANGAYYSADSSGHLTQFGTKS